jgi:hypothetical protein
VTKFNTATPMRMAVVVCIVYGTASPTSLRTDAHGIEEG